jgi:cell fate regulator YaaT (PSP1 superfamily)
MACDLIQINRIADGEEITGGCGTGAERQCGNGLEKIYPTTVVRYGYMKHIGEFTYPPEMKFTCGAKVVVQTHRGTEIGELVSLTCTGCDKHLSRDQIKEYIENSGAESCKLENGRVIREVTSDDMLRQHRLVKEAADKRRRCQELATERELDMKVIECEHLFGDDRLLFYFTSESRVDFRGLVRDLVADYSTRIEMRQVGARDEARLLADFETCGQECCCKVFLKTLKPISMKMAKLQKATLDPSKVSGRCGRLKCCLRYEHPTYDEFMRRLPRIGKRVATVHGNGVVVDRQIMTQLVQVRTDDGQVITVVIEDITGDAPPAQPPSETSGDSSRRPVSSRGPATRGQISRPPVRPRPDVQKPLPQSQPAADPEIPEPAKRQRPEDTSDEDTSDEDTSDEDTSDEDTSDEDTNEQVGDVDQTQSPQGGKDSAVESRDQIIGKSEQPPGGRDRKGNKRMRRRKGGRGRRKPPKNE